MRDNTGNIGEHIAGIIDGFKSQADDLMARANAIDDAWAEWDIDELLRLGAITRSMFDFLYLDRARQVADDR
jgi:hypothetical protein